MERDQVLRLDREDALAGLRDAFILPADTIYLDGNSLGPVTHAARQALIDTVDDEWGAQLIGAWNSADWVHLPSRVGALIAPLIGAGVDDVICCDSTSINLAKVMAAALDLRATRSRVVSERGNFPTDLYMAERCAARAGHGQHVTWVDSAADIEALIDDDLAVLMLTHVDYRTGDMHDMKALTARAHAVGALVVWDLAHSAGAVPVHLADADADFAVGCGYKYLNGGPGAPAFLYVSPALQSEASQPLAGWFGHAAPFDFTPDYRPADGVQSFLTGTPPILGMRALEASLSLWRGADLAAVRAKSMALGDLFIDTVEAVCDELVLASPRDARRRGSQVSFRHPAAYAIMQALIAEGVIGDMRSPDILRFGFAPLYTRYVDVVAAAERLVAIVDERRFDAPRYRQKAAVT